MSSATAALPVAGIRPRPRAAFGVKSFAMAASLIVLGAYLVYPVLLLLVLSFNQAPNTIVPPFEWGLGNWTEALSTPGLFQSLGNSLIIWSSVTVVSLPVAIIGGAIGSYLGSRRFPVRTISMLLATVLVVAGCKLIFTR